MFCPHLSVFLHSLTDAVGEIYSIMFRYRPRYFLPAIRDHEIPPGSPALLGFLDRRTERNGDAPTAPENPSTCQFSLFDFKLEVDVKDLGFSKGNVQILEIRRANAGPDLVLSYCRIYPIKARHSHGYWLWGMCPGSAIVIVI